MKPSSSALSAIPILRLSALSAEPVRHIELLADGATAEQDPEPGDALNDFVAAARPWSERPMALSRRTAVGLWIVVGIGVGVGVVMLRLLPFLRTCEHFACSVATLGGRPVLTLVLTAVGVVGLLVAAGHTHGFSRTGARGLILIVPAAAVTATSVLGPLLVVAAVVLLLIIGMVVVVLALAVADRV